MRIIILLLSFALIADVYLACSANFDAREFKINSNIDIEAKTPYFVVDSIDRGKAPVKPGQMCTGTAHVILKNLDSPKNEQGYIFELVNGKVEEPLFVSRNIEVAHRSSKGHDIITFSWEDGNTWIQEPIDLTIKIIAVSTSGVESAPQYLNVYHPGINTE